MTRASFYYIKNRVTFEVAHGFRWARNSNFNNPKIYSSHRIVGGNS